MASHNTARLRTRRFPAIGGLVAVAAVTSACGGSTRPASTSGSASSTPAPVTVAVPASAAPTTTTSTLSATAGPDTTLVASSAPGAGPTAPPATTPTTAAAASNSVHATACPSNLASTLAATGSARQLITVESTGYRSTSATLETWERDGGCWVAVSGPVPARIGQSGFADHHVEGDGTSPTGAYGIGPVMYGNAPDPGVHEAYHRLVCGDWWDEDPSSPAYNTFQHVACGSTPPFAGGSEALWTETQSYPSFAVIDYNTDPVRPYAGSGIFLHADTGTPTDGCVSIPLAQLDQVLRWIDPAEHPLVVMGPAQEISRF